MHRKLIRYLPPMTILLIIIAVLPFKTFAKPPGIEIPLGFKDTGENNFKPMVMASYQLGKTSRDAIDIKIGVNIIGYWYGFVDGYKGVDENILSGGSVQFGYIRPIGNGFFVGGMFGGGYISYDLVQTNPNPADYGHGVGTFLFGITGNFKSYYAGLIFEISNITDFGEGDVNLDELVYKIGALFCL